MWNPLYTVGGKHRAIVVYGDPTAQPALLQKRSERFRGLIADREEPHRFSLKLLDELVPVGNGHEAGATPGGPEIQHHRGTL